MIEERRKAEVISQELLRYFFHHEIQEIQMKVVFQPKDIVIEVSGQIDMAPTDLHEFTQLLNVDRDSDLEDYLEGLVGSHHEAEDFALLGLMTDDAFVSYQYPNLNVKLYRNLFLTE